MRESVPQISQGNLVACQERCRSEGGVLFTSVLFMHHLGLIKAQSKTKRSTNLVAGNYVDMRGEDSVSVFWLVALDPYLQRVAVMKCLAQNKDLRALRVVCVAKMTS